MDRLLREANPPTGQLASPKPQYKKPGEDAYEPVEGQYGAPFAILKNASGQVISPATDAKLEQLKSELELIKSELQTIKANQLSGDQKVQLSGTINELIKEYRDELVGLGPVYYGATRDASCLPLDVSAYKDIAFTIHNRGDRLIKLWAFQLYPRADLPRKSDHNRLLASIPLSAMGGNTGDIPAGARLHVSSVGYPILLTPSSGLVLQFYTPDMQGSTLIDISIVGVRV